jgi:hypothetical protein
MNYVNKSDRLLEVKNEIGEKLKKEGVDSFLLLFDLQQYYRRHFQINVWHQTSEVLSEINYLKNYIWLP